MMSKIDKTLKNIVFIIFNFFILNSIFHIKLCCNVWKSHQFNIKKMSIIMYDFFKNNSKNSKKKCTIFFFQINWKTLKWVMRHKNLFNTGIQCRYSQLWEKIVKIQYKNQIFKFRNIKNICIFDIFIIFRMYQYVENVNIFQHF